MKIKKTYQGSVPLNRISNQKDSSELNTYSTQYLNNKLVCVSPYSPEDGEMVWIQKSNNLFPGWNIGQYYGSSNGVLVENDSNSSTDLIPVDFTTNNKYTFSNLPGTSNIYISAFDSKRVYVGRTASGIKTEYTFYPSRLQSSGAGSGDANDIKYIAVTYQNIDVLDNTMLNLGPDALPYEPYVQPKIFVKNNDGSYEEFYKPITVTDGVEFETGRIVNGKKEYCTRLNLGPLPNATAIDYQTGLDSSYIVTNYHLYGLGSDTRCFSLPFFNLSNTSYHVLGYVKGGPSVVCTKSNYDVSAYDLIVEIAYTK